MIRQSTRYTSPASQLLRHATWVLPLCLLARGLVASAGDPAPGQRQPTTNPTTRQDRSGGDNQRGWREPTAEEWDAAVLFLKEHNPRRLAIYEEAVASWRKSQGEVVDPEAELPRNIRGARARIYTRVHFLRMLEEHDPELYEFALGQFRLEDQVIGHLLARLGAGGREGRIGGRLAPARGSEHDSKGPAHLRHRTFPTRPA